MKKKKEEKNEKKGAGGVRALDRLRRHEMVGEIRHAHTLEFY